MRHQVAESALEQLLEHRDEIESEIGSKQEWNPYPENRDKVIVLTKDADLEDSATWDSNVEWMAQSIVVLRKAFRPRVKNLELSDSNSYDEAPDVGETE